MAKLKLLSKAQKQVITKRLTTKPLELEIFFDNEETGECERQTATMMAHDTLYLNDDVTIRGGRPVIIIHYDPDKPISITLNVDRKGQCDDPDETEKHKDHR